MSVRGPVLNSAVMQAETPKSEKCTRLRTLGERFVSRLEEAFYRHGVRVALHPLLFIAFSLVATAMCALGLLSFHHEKQPFRLWLSPHSDFVNSYDWMLENFAREFVVEYALVTADNVLDVEVVREMALVTSRVASTRSEAVGWHDVCARLPADSSVSRAERHLPSTSSSSSPSSRSSTSVLADMSRSRRQVPRAEFNSSWTWFDASAVLPSIIYCPLVESLPRACWESNLLELWRFDSELVGRLDRQAVLDSVNRVTVSPVFGYHVGVDRWLGGVVRNASGHVVSARAALFTWLVRRNLSAAAAELTDVGTGERLDAHTVEFEQFFLSTLRSADDRGPSGVRWYYSAARSFGDVSGAAVWGDVRRLVLGYCVMFVFIELTLGRISLVHHRVLLSLAGVSSVLLAVIIACGLGSAFGFSYGPVHNILPLLLLGLGVDDMFVLLQSWRPARVGSGGGEDPLVQQVGVTMRQAGVSITVTSITDLAAFAVGASTALPALRSFCVFAALGVFAVYLLQATWLVAWFTLDQRRIADGRDGLLPFLRHSVSSSRQPAGLWLETCFRRWYSPALLSTAGRVFVLLVSLALAAFTGYGLLQLRQEFEPLRFLPSTSYLSQYHQQLQRYFPDRGAEGVVFVSGVDLSTNLAQVAALTHRLSAEPSVERVDSWYSAFANYTEIGAGERTLSAEQFNTQLSQFLFSSVGAKYRHHFRLAGELVCGRPAPRVLTFLLTFTHRVLAPDQRIPAMRRVKRVARSASFNGSAVSVVPLCQQYAAWETDEVIGQELARNLALSLLAVVIVTWLLLAGDPLACCLVVSAVILTIGYTAGLMHWCGLTIDTVSCIDLVLGVGLCVDYSAHVVHAYLTQRRLRRVSRGSAAAEAALNQIGPAVLCGGVSTFLAFVFLAGSESHVFDTFFCVLVSVTVLGLFNGLAVLPAVLSLLGPSESVPSQSWTNGQPANGTSLHPSVSNGSSSKTLTVTKF